MNRKEVILSLILVFSLGISISHLTKEDCYDCVQTMFSNNSSCSDYGSTCVREAKKGGVTGLWNFFTSLKMEETDDSFVLSCAPDCSMEFNKTHQHDSDTAHQTPHGTYR